MAVTVGDIALDLRLVTDPTADVPEAYRAVIQRALDTALALVAHHAHSAPESLKDQATIAIAAYLYDRPSAAAGNRFANAWVNSGASTMLGPWITRRVGVIGGTDTPASTGAPADLSLIEPFARVDRTERVTANRLPMPPSPAEAANGVATTLRSWTAALVRVSGVAAALSVLPAWARAGDETPIPAAKLTNAPGGGGGAAGPNINAMQMRWLASCGFRRTITGDSPRQVWGTWGLATAYRRASQDDGGGLYQPEGGDAITDPASGVLHATDDNPAALVWPPYSWGELVPAGDPRNNDEFNRDLWFLYRGGEAAKNDWEVASLGAVDRRDITGAPSDEITYLRSRHLGDRDPSSLGDTAYQWTRSRLWPANWLPYGYLELWATETERTGLGGTTITFEPRLLARVPINLSGLGPQRVVTDGQNQPIPPGSIGEQNEQTAPADVTSRRTFLIKGVLDDPGDITGNPEVIEVGVTIELSDTEGLIIYEPWDPGAAYRPPAVGSGGQQTAFSSELIPTIFSEDTLNNDSLALRLFLGYLPPAGESNYALEPIEPWAERGSSTPIPAAKLANAPMGGAREGNMIIAYSVAKPITAATLAAGQATAGDAAAFPAYSGSETDVHVAVAYPNAWGDFLAFTMDGVGVAGTDGLFARQAGTVTVAGVPYRVWVTTENQTAADLPGSVAALWFTGRRAGGGGLGQAAVDARVRSGVEDWAEADNEDPIPAPKLANAPSGLTKGTSVELALNASETSASAAHGLTTVAFVVGYFECTTAERGFAVGDRVYVENPRTVSIGSDGANVFVAMDRNTIQLVPKAGGSAGNVSVHNWKLVAVPYGS